MSDFNVLDNVPSVNRLLKMPMGYYKVRDKAIVILSLPEYIWVYYTDLDDFGNYNRRQDVYRLVPHIEETANRIIDYVKKRCKTDTDNTPVEYLMQRYVQKTRTIHNYVAPQLGVELELEEKDYDSFSSNEANELRRKHRKYIDEIGGDVSVYNGCEIRFKHPNLKNWNFDEIKQVLEDVKATGLDSYYGTAGMHVHISGRGLMKVINRSQRFFKDVEAILLPISCRRAKITNPGRTSDDRFRYGLGDNMIKNQASNFGTIEIRVFEATTDPEIFHRRLKFCDTLFRYLRSRKSIKNFFKNITDEERENYRYLLLDKNNPHAFGDNIETVLLKLN